MNVLTGIFVERAMRAVRPDEKALQSEQVRKEKAAMAEFHHIFQELSEGSGVLGFDDFMEAMSEGSLRPRLATLGLDIRDAEVFFVMLAAANNTEELDMSAFVHGCMALRGPAAMIDTQSVVFHATLIQRNLLTVERDVGELRRMVDRGDGLSWKVSLV